MNLPFEQSTLDITSKSTQMIDQTLSAEDQLFLDALHNEKYRSALLQLLYKGEYKDV